MLLSFTLLNRALLSLIRRNTRLYSATLAGAGSGLMRLSRVLVSYPSGALRTAFLAAVALGLLVPLGWAVLFSVG